MDRFNSEVKKAVRHVQCWCELYRGQLDKGMYVLHEHPCSATSWKLPCVVHLSEDSKVQVTRTHMYQFGMTSHLRLRGGEVCPVKKETCFMTNSTVTSGMLDRQCKMSSFTSSSWAEERYVHTHVRTSCVRLYAVG